MRHSNFPSLPSLPLALTAPIARRRFLALGAATAVLAPATGWAQAGADRPVRFVLPVSAGSGVDTIVRACGPALTKALGHPAVIENLPGAGGITGTATLVKSAPDGFTLSVVSNNHVIYPSVYKSLPFDPIADITPIAVLGTTPLALVVNPNRIKAKNVGEMLALLRANPGKYNYGSAGNGTILHLAAAMFIDEAGVSAQHVPYKGTGPLITDLIGGQVDFAVIAVPAILPHIKAGSLGVIGLGTAARSPLLPDVPTVAEQGLPNYVVDGWFAVVGPAKLPEPVVKQVHDAFVTAMAAPEVQDAMQRQGNVIQVSTPEAAAKFFRDERDKYARVVKAAGVSVT